MFSPRVWLYRFIIIMLYDFRRAVQSLLYCFIVAVLLGGCRGVVVVCRCFLKIARAETTDQQIIFGSSPSLQNALDDTCHKSVTSHSKIRHGGCGESGVALSE